MSMMFKIMVNDKGNPSIEKLIKNAKTAEKSVAPLGDVLEKVFASAVMLSGISHLVQGLQAAGREAALFNQNMMRIKGIGGVTKGLDEMSKTVRDLAINTEYSASQISSSMLSMVKAGFDDPMSVAKAMPDIVDLATVAMMDLNYASENTVDILRAFNLQNNEVSRVTNVMAKSLNLTTMEAEDYFEAIKYVSSVSNAMNVSLEETSVMLSILANAGIKGSQAGTSLRSILLNLMQPGKAVEKGLESMNLKGKSLSEILVGLRQRGLTVIDFLKTFDKTAITSSMVMSDPKSVNNYNKLVDALHNSKNEVKDQATIIREAFIPQLLELRNTAYEVGMSIGEAFGENPVEILKDLKSALLDLNTWVDNNHESFQKVGKIMEKIIDLGTNLGSIVTTTLVKDFDLLVTSAGILIGLKGIGGVSKGFKDLKGSLDFFGKGDFKFTNLITGLGGITTAVSLLAIGVDSLIESFNKRIDQVNSNNSDMSVDSLKKQYAVFKLLYENGEEMEKMKAAMQKQRGTASIGSWETTQYTDYANEVKRLQAELKRDYGRNYNLIDHPEDIQKVKNEVDNLRKAYQLLGREKIKNGSKTTPKNDFDLSDRNTDIAGDKHKFKPKGVLEYLGYDIEQINYEISRIKEEKASVRELQKYLNSLDDDYDDPVWDAMSGYRETFHLDDKKEYDNINKDHLSSFVDDMGDFLNKGSEQYKKATDSMKESLWSMGSSTLDLWSNINDKMLNKTLNRLDKEKEAITRRFDAEINSASISAFKREQLETEKTQAILELQKKEEEAKKVAAREQQVISIFQGIIQGTQAVIAAMADTHGDVYTRIAAGLSIGAVVASLVAEITAQNLRSGGLVNGPGNGTSDSVPTRLSKGEYVLNKQTVDSFGGQSGLEAVIDRSMGRSSSRGDVYISTMIGTEEYIKRVIIPILVKEQRKL